MHWPTNFSSLYIHNPKGKAETLPYTAEQVKKRFIPWYNNNALQDQNAALSFFPACNHVSRLLQNSCTQLKKSGKQMPGEPSTSQWGGGSWPSDSHPCGRHASSLQQHGNLTPPLHHSQIRGAKCSCPDQRSQPTREPIGSPVQSHERQTQVGLGRRWLLPGNRASGFPQWHPCVTRSGQQPSTVILIRGERLGSNCQPMLFS